MLHYIYNAAGVMRLLGLKKTNQVAQYKKRAAKKNVKVSVIKGGVEYFDIDLLRSMAK